MLPDALPQLIGTLLRLPHLEAAQLRELIQHLPDPQTSAQEMVRRGWITPDQFASLFPGAQPSTPRETILISCGDDEVPPDADCDNWDLTVSDEEDKAEVLPEVEGTRAEDTDERMPPEPVPMLCGAATTSQFEWDLLAPSLAGEIMVRHRESDTDKQLRQWMGWASKGLLIWILFVGSFIAGRQLLGVHSPAPRVARQQPTVAPIAKRKTASPRLAAAIWKKVPNNKSAVVDPPGAIELPQQPVALVPEPAAAPPVMLPAPANPQQLPAIAAPAVWNGPFMFPAQYDPHQFPLNPTPQDIAGYQLWVRQRQMAQQQQTVRQQQMMQKRMMQKRQRMMQRNRHLMQRQPIQVVWGQ